MILKRKSLIITVILIITIQVLLYLNNNQKTSFRYFIWNIQEVKLGKLISISFFSGLIMSLILNNSILSDKKLTDKEGKNTYKNEDDEFIKDEINQSSDLPPQRNVSEVQPTISVNYRVIKKGEDDYFKDQEDFNNRPIYKDDWEDDSTEW